MPKKPCATPGCRTLLDVGEAHCARHAPLEKRSRDMAVDRARGSEEYRRWYARKAWRGPGGRRAVQLAKEPLCAMCPDWSRQPATVADHVVPHRGDHGLFWFGALQSLCKPCHDSKKQRIERRAAAGGEGQTSQTPDVKPAGIIGFFRDGFLVGGSV